MIRPTLVLCNKPSHFSNPFKDVHHNTVNLSTDPDDESVIIKFDQITDRVTASISGKDKDLIEIASLVYAADCAIGRGTGWDYKTNRESWSRQFHFVIPVRDINFWNSEEINASIRKILAHLSSDEYSFEFIKYVNKDNIKLYFDKTGQNPSDFSGINRVALFSGGLDSLSGAIDCLSKQENVILVGHKPASLIKKQQEALFNALNNRFSPKSYYIPIVINKAKYLGREHTQRTRSFLYASIASVVSNISNCSTISFFENGVTSLNLPIADEVIQSRASRTTHPLFFHNYNLFLNKFSINNASINNPFHLKTKRDIVELIVSNNCGELIAKSRSCSHSMNLSSNQKHCGFCGQCIDRRLALLSANIEHFDDPTDYYHFTFTEPRTDTYNKNVAIGYIRHAMEIHNESRESIASRFSLEFSRATRYADNPSSLADEYIDAHKRHGASVSYALEKIIKQNMSSIINGTVEKDSFLSLMLTSEHSKPLITRYIGRITQILNDGLPRACATNKPLNEQHLQEICDGILHGSDSIRLSREFPFLRWASALTKPDWSVDGLNLLIELKYIKSTPSRYTKEIAEDIIKYGDNDMSVLFVAYDPEHKILDENNFCALITKHQNMFVSIIR